MVILSLSFSAKSVSSRTSTSAGSMQRSRSDVDVNAAASAKSRMPAVPTVAPYSSAAALPPGSYASLGKTSHTHRMIDVWMWWWTWTVFICWYLLLHLLTSSHLKDAAGDAEGKMCVCLYSMCLSLSLCQFCVVMLWVFIRHTEERCLVPNKLHVYIQSLFVWGFSWTGLVCLHQTKHMIRCVCLRVKQHER